MKRQPKREDSRYRGDHPDMKRPRPMEARSEDGFCIISVLGSGTFGTVYKVSRRGDSGGPFYALKEFKESKDKDQKDLKPTTIREIGLLRELNHENIIKLVQVLIHPEKISLGLVFDYAEFDLLKIIKKNEENLKNGILVPENMVRSCMWQILNGLHYIHSNWIIHRDMKPSNVMVMGKGSECFGQVKIGDFGLARVFRDPPQPLSEDGVVVTIWYRAPELLLMSKHYTPAIDIWAVGCIFGELLTCEPMFQSKEIPTQSRIPAFQVDQCRRIFEVLGMPKVEIYKSFQHWSQVSSWEIEGNFDTKYRIDESAKDLLRGLLDFDPTTRLTAEQALRHRYFQVPFSDSNVFADTNYEQYSAFAARYNRHISQQPPQPQPQHRHHQPPPRGFM